MNTIVLMNTYWLREIIDEIATEAIFINKPKYREWNLFISLYTSYKIIKSIILRKQINLH